MKIVIVVVNGQILDRWYGHTVGTLINNEKVVKTNCRQFVTRSSKGVVI